MFRKQLTRKSIAALSVGIAISLTGCESIPSPCPGWVKETLPIKPSRSDKLTRGTQNQIVTANESWEAHCK
jgi:hypothetical protein